MSPCDLIVRLAFASILLGLSGCWTGGRADTKVVEERLSLPVAIDGEAVELDTLIVRPAAPGRFPLALIVNGSSREPRSLDAASLAHLAHDFAHRGWLAASVIWPGYGRSTGAIQPEAGTCTAPQARLFLDVHADDLAAALVALRRRPDVDRTMTLGVGISIGGASMLDLAARPDHPLTAVINISGGLYLYDSAKPFQPDPTCGPFETDLARAFKSFGRASVPTLWLYAENDPWFRPALVRRLLAAYRAGGGRADFTMFPPFGSDGHTLFLQTANALTQAVIDTFLRQHDLPAMDGDDSFAPLIAALDPGERDYVGQYLSAPSEKALAVPESGLGVYWYYGSRSIDEARRKALANCETESKTTCRLIAENRTLLAGWRAVMAQRQSP